MWTLNPSMRWWVGIALAALVAGVALVVVRPVALFGAPPLPVVGRVAGRAPIVLITLDTLRRDHVGLYGYFRDTTPHLDAFADDAVVFDDAIATTANTTPSHLSMLTGLLLHQHGITSNARPLTHPFEPGPGRRLLAELLRDDGYRTAAFVSAAPLRAETGIAAGFEVYGEPEERKRRCEITVDEAIRWLEGVDGEPFFLWVHLWDPHAPNTPLPEYRAMFPSDPRVGALLDARGIDPVAIARTEDRDALRRFLIPGRSIRRHGLEVDRERLMDLIDRYDADIRYTDQCVGDLLAALKRLGVYDDAVLAVTADHGQLLGEHAHLGHGLLYEDDIRVPLIMRFPDALGVAPARVAPVVSLVDMMPTAVARMDTPAAATFLAQAQGADVFAPGWSRSVAFSQMRQEGYSLDPGTTLAAVGSRWKLFYTIGRDRTLYDRVADPREVAPCDDDAMAGALAEEVRAVLDVNPAPRSGRGRKPSAHQREELEALGYVVP